MSKKRIAQLNIVLVLTTLLLVFNQCVAPTEAPTALDFGGGGREPSSEGSLEGYRDNVYPLTRQYCISCHSSQSPVHASNDVQEAHDSVIDEFKVNFANISKSRMVLKLVDENHNCWNDCAQDALEMEDALKAWQVVRENSVEPEVVGQPPIMGDECKITEVQEVVETAADSVGEFQKSLYGLTSMNCIPCHIDRGPRHANGDLNIAHDDLINGDWIDFTNPNQSRLVTKIQGGHQGKAALTSQMILEITKWATNRGAVVKTVVTKKVQTGDCGVLGGTPVSRSVENIISGAAGGATAVITKLDVNTANILDNDFELVGAGANAYIQSKVGTVASTGTADNDGGYATINFNLAAAGNYKLSADIMAPDGGTDSFWIKIDNEAYFQWHVGTHAAFGPEVLTQTSGRTEKTWMNLAAGNHVLHIKHREPQTAIRNIQIYPQGAGVMAGGSFAIDISSPELSGVPGATLTGNISNFDDFTYQMTNLRVNSTEDIYVKNIRFYMNGQYNPQHSAFTIVDKVVGPNDPEVSPYSMLILKDNGPSGDTFQFTFEIIQQN